MEQTRSEILNNDFAGLTLSEIVNRNFKAAAVFEKYNLDFCCGGKKPVAEACREKGLSSSQVFEELQTIENKGSRNDNYADWEIDFLIDYVVNNHHAYINRMIPILSAHTQKIAAVHGKNHPKLLKVAESFEKIYKELRQHMMKEEQMLFPFVKLLAITKRSGKKTEAPFFGTVKNPIRMMEAEHQAAGDEMYEIRSLTNGYSIPEDGCSTYSVTMQELKDFEEDLHKHIYLENYILFPKAVELEQELL
jgi:regulator of cell morphogenesis and NO signaling